MTDYADDAWKTLRDSQSFDADSGAPEIKNKSVALAISKTWPADYKTNFSYYYATWVHFAVYTLTFIWAHRQQLNFKDSAFAVVFSPFWAWSLFCILMIGHEAEHQTLVPKNSSFNWINKVMGVACWDPWLMSAKEWNSIHNGIHHKDAGGPADLMHLSLQGFVHEFYFVVMAVLTWIYHDFQRFFSGKTDPTQKTLLGVGIICRFYVWLSVGYQTCLVNFIVFALLANYVGLLPHAQPLRSKGIPQDYFVLQLRETWDFFPQSGLASFLSGGVNAHATHHIFPYVPRSLHSLGSTMLEKYYADEYRKVEGVVDWTVFFLERATIH